MWASPALAQTRQTSSVTYTTTQPGAPTGFEWAMDFQNPEDPAGKPYAVASVASQDAPGAVVDFSVLPVCEASDAELYAQGAAACPAESRLGGGKIVSDNGGPGVPLPRLIENDVELFNGGDHILGVADSTNAPLIPGLTRLVTRSPVEGDPPTTTFELPPFPGGPPDNYTALKSMRLSGPAAIRGGRAAARTPPVCPESGYWTLAQTFVYRDGVTQRVESRSPCEPPGADARGCLARRARVGRRGVGRIRLGRSRARLLGLPVRAPERSGRVMRWCVKGSKGFVAAVLNRRKRVVVVVTTAPGHRHRGLRPGGRPPAPSAPARVFWAATGHEVLYIGTATRRLLRRRAALGRALRQALQV